MARFVRNSIVPALLLALLLFTFIHTTSVPVNAGGVYTITVNIEQPENDTKIHYCTHFNVKVHIGAPDDIITNVSTAIYISGNAELVSPSMYQTKDSLG